MCAFCLCRFRIKGTERTRRTWQNITFNDAIHHRLRQRWLFGNIERYDNCVINRSTGQWFTAMWDNDNNYNLSTAPTCTILRSSSHNNKMATFSAEHSIQYCVYLSAARPCGKYTTQVCMHYVLWFFFHLLSYFRHIFANHGKCHNQLHIVIRNAFFFLFVSFFSSTHYLSCIRFFHLLALSNGHEPKRNNIDKRNNLQIFAEFIEKKGFSFARKSRAMPTCVHFRTFVRAKRQ